MTQSHKCLVSFISTFFTTSTRGKNDEANSKREMVIEQIGNPPTEFMEDELLGANWKYVKAEWDKAIQIVATKTNVTEPYASYRIEKKGGRKFNYDGVVMFYNEGGEVIASRKIEFKYGATNVNSVPQFLSLTTKKYQHMFREETATAASTADPPRRNTVIPASTANGLAAVTNGPRAWDDAGDDAVIHMARFPGKDFGQRHAFVLGLVGQHWANDGIADGI